MGTCVSRPVPRDSSKLFPGVRATQSSQPGIIVLRPPGVHLSQVQAQSQLEGRKQAQAQTRAHAQPVPSPQPTIVSEQESSLAIDKETGRQAGAAATADIANAHALAASAASAEAAAAAAAISLHLALADLEKPLSPLEPSSLVDPATISAATLDRHTSADTTLYAPLDETRENETIEFSDKSYSPSALAA